MAKGITEALIDFAFDPNTGEGPESALEKGQAWRDTLVEMVEIANLIEMRALNELCSRVCEALTEICKREEPHCQVCKRAMDCDEIGDEFPDERVCIQCASNGGANGQSM